MVRLVQRDARPGAHSLDSPDAGPGAAVSASTPERLDTAERERRSHIRRWATFMIVHLDRSEHDDARHYGYEEALERLQALIARELAEVREGDGNRSPES